MMPLTAEEIRAMTLLALAKPPQQSELQFLFTIQVDSDSAQAVTGGGSVLWEWAIVYLLFDGVIDWGDGTQTEYHKIEIPGTYRIDPVYHDYAETGTYQLALRGSLRAIAFGRSGNPYLPDQYWLKWAKGLISVDSPLPPKPSVYAADGTYFYDLFYQCARLTRIPSGLFDAVNAGGVRTQHIERVFGGCASLVSIPSGIFDSLNIGITGKEDNLLAYGMFRDCAKLKSVPNGLFSNPGFGCFSDMHSLFDGCSALSSIPTGIFDECVNVLNLTGCFRGCSALAAVPDELFKNCSKATDLSYAFYGCNALAGLPAGLLSGIIAVQNLSYAFSRCYALTSIPSGLLDDCISVNNFSEIFRYCTALRSVPQDLFDNCDEATEDSFSNAFNADSAITSSVPALWVKYPGRTTTNRCFWNCTQAVNYSDIPTTWR